jgi:hypothetical protein
MIRMAYFEPAAIAGFFNGEMVGVNIGWSNYCLTTFQKQNNQ